MSDTAGRLQSAAACLWFGAEPLHWRAVGGDQGDGRREDAGAQEEAAEELQEQAALPGDGQADAEEAAVLAGLQVWQGRQEEGAPYISLALLTTVRALSPITSVRHLRVLRRCEDRLLMLWTAHASTVSANSALHMPLKSSKVGVQNQGYQDGLPSLLETIAHACNHASMVDLVNVCRADSCWLSAERLRLHADRLHVHDEEGEHLFCPGWPWRQGGRGGLREAHDSGAHPAAARVWSRRHLTLTLLSCSRTSTDLMTV